MTNGPGGDTPPAAGLFLVASACSGDVVNLRIDIPGTLFGALCFLGRSTETL